MDVIAARMAEQRERSGLFFAWDPLPPADEGQYEGLQEQYGLPLEQGYGASWEKQRQSDGSEERCAEQQEGEEGVAAEGQA